MIRVSATLLRARSRVRGSIPVMGRISGSLAKAGAAHLLLKFNATAKKRLRHARSVKLNLVAKVSDTAGNLTSKRQPITLHR